MGGEGVKMENYKLVLPEHLNHYGFLFGGALLQWVDEVAYITATLQFTGSNFVTIGMDRVEFKKSVRQGDILRFDVQLAKKGRSAVTYSVKVYKKEVTTGIEEIVFQTNITFVSVDEKGIKPVLLK